MADTFRAALAQVGDLMAGDHSAWDYDGLRAGTQALAEMASALKVIMAPDTEKEIPCPGTIRTGDGVKSTSPSTRTRTKS
jgi:hypothetical protein